MKKAERKERQAPSREMLEKYYHIKGALAYDEGRMDQAIRFFRKALALDDQPYIRSHLSLAYEEKNDIGRALMQISRAIELSPSNADYYLRRSALWEDKGDHVKADEDWSAAMSLAANYNRTVEVKEALRAIRNGFVFGETDEWLGTVEARDGRLRAIVEGIIVARGGERQSVENRSCPVPCPAYCCHFSKELFLHGVFVGPWKLRAIRARLREQGVREERLLEKRTVSRAELRLRLIPPDVIINKEGESTIFYPKRTEKRVGLQEASTIPPAVDYSRIDWITAESRACAFLTEGRCTIHDLGEDPALPACKEFLCLTGLILLVMIHLGILEEGETLALSIGDSNRIAIDASLLLAKRIYANRRVLEIKEAIIQTVKDAVEADEHGDTERLMGLIERHRRLAKRLNRSHWRQRRRLRADIVKLLGGTSQ